MPRLWGPTHLFGSGRSMALWPSFWPDPVWSLRKPTQAEAYRHLNLGIRTRSRSKGRQSDRSHDAEAMLCLGQNSRGRSQPATSAMRFLTASGKGKDGEDRFDAVVGLLGMLAVVRGIRPSGEPKNCRTDMEGWILGQAAVRAAGC